MYRNDEKIAVDFIQKLGGVLKDFNWGTNSAF